MLKLCHFRTFLRWLRLVEAESSCNVMAHGDAPLGKWRGNWANAVRSQCPSHYLGTRFIQHYYLLMPTPRLPAVDWTDAPTTDLNGLVRFAERRNLVSARVPSRFNWPLHSYPLLCVGKRNGNEEQQMKRIRSVLLLAFQGQYLYEVYRWSFKFLWPCIVSKLWTEREKTIALGSCGRASWANCEQREKKPTRCNN